MNADEYVQQFGVYKNPHVQRIDVPDSRAQLVALRRITGAGYMTCLKALEACDGDLRAAIERIPSRRAGA